MLIALWALLTLVVAYPTAIDNAAYDKEWLEQLTFATSTSGILAMVYTGIVFWLVLLKVDEPEDSGLGRGEG